MSLLAKYRDLSEPLAFGGRNLASRYHTGKKREIETELSKIPAYYFHREVKRPKFYNPIYVYRTRDLLQADLVHLMYLEDSNDGVKYLLVVVDSFSRFCWVRPLKTAQGQECLNAFQEIYAETGRFKALYCDRGPEFRNRLMLRFLNKEGIQLRFPNNKCGTVERLNRSLQSLIYRYLTDRASNRYIDKLDSIVHLYNNRWHTSIKCTPAYADDPLNRKYVLNILSMRYDKIERQRKKPKYKIGDTVLIQKDKGVFAKGYERVFVRERYKIIKVHTSTPIPMYSLRTALDPVRRNGRLVDINENLTGRWYENELQPIKDETYRVSIVQRRRDRQTGRPQSLVHFEGYPSNQDAWYFDDELETL